MLQTPVRKMSLGQRMRCGMTASLLMDTEFLYAVAFGRNCAHHTMPFCMEVQRKAPQVDRVMIIENAKFIVDGRC